MGERPYRRTSWSARAKTVDRGGEMQCSRHGIVSVVGRERGVEMIDAVGRERGGQDDRPRRWQTTEEKNLVSMHAMAA